MPKHTTDLLFNKLRPSQGTAPNLSIPVPRRPDGDSSTATEPAVRLRTLPIRGDATVTSQPASAVPQSVPGEPISFDNGRLTLSLTSTSAGVVAFALVMLMALAFWAGSSWGEGRGRTAGFKQGRESYSKEASDEIEQARAQQPDQELVSELLTDRPVTPPSGSLSPSIPASESAADADVRKVAWVEGYNYIVVQQFSSSALDDARAAQQYLLDNQIPTAIVRVKDGYRLVTIEGFNFKEPTQRQRADLLKKRITGIGQRYMAAGGRYKLEGYFAAYKGGW